jgi:hypothetical protein
MGEGLINIFKFVIFVLLLPVVIATAQAFAGYFQTLPSQLQEFLLWGCEAFLITFIFVHPFRGMYDFGQKIIESLFKFVSPLQIYAASLFPFYTLLILLALFICDRFLDLSAYKPYFYFFIGFTYTMHVILMAAQLQEQEKSLIKPTYFLMGSLILILNLILAVLFLNGLVAKFTFPDFFQAALNNAWNIYVDIFHKIASIKPPK